MTLPFGRHLDRLRRGYAGRPLCADPIDGTHGQAGRFANHEALVGRRRRSCLRPADLTTDPFRAGLTEAGYIDPVEQVENEIERRSMRRLSHAEIREIYGQRHDWGAR